jgi:hypothetical protein
VNIKISGKWMFIPLKMVLIGIDPYPYQYIYIYIIMICILYNIDLYYIYIEDYNNPIGEFLFTNQYNGMTKDILNTVQLFLD